MAKADKKSITRAVPRHDLPLDDPRWVLLIKIALPRLFERIGDQGLAVRELEPALAQGRVRCKTRSVVTGVCELLESAAWTERLKLHPLGFGEHAPWGVVYRGPPDDSYLLKVKVFDGLVFAWRPDLEAAWPAIWPPADSAPIDHDDASNAPPPRVRPGPKPTGDWPALLAQWLIEVAADDRHRLQNVDALVIEARIFLDTQIGWAPKDDKDLRAKIVELLRLVRR